MTIKERDKKVMVMPCNSSNCFQINWRKRKKKDISLQTKYELRTKRVGLALPPVLNWKNANDRLTEVVSTLVALLA